MTYHGVGKGCRDSNEHPPHNPLEELLAVALDKRFHNSAIHLGDSDTDQSPQDQEEGMTDQQSGFLTPPAGYDDFAQPQERPEELAVQLNLLLRRILAACGRSCAATCGALR